jgi:hypothetical protein
MNALFNWRKGQVNLDAFHGDRRMTESFWGCNIIIA